MEFNLARLRQILESLLIIETALKILNFEKLDQNDSTRNTLLSFIIHFKLFYGIGNNRRNVE